MEHKHLDIKERFAIYAEAPYAVSDPDRNQMVAIAQNGNYRDTKQKNFTIIMQTIGIRIQPILLQAPEAIKDLSKVSNLHGEGYSFIIGTEYTDGFIDAAGDRTGFMKSQLDGMILYNKTKLSFYENPNIEIHII